MAKKSKTQRAKASAARQARKAQAAEREANAVEATVEEAASEKKGLFKSKAKTADAKPAKKAEEKKPAKPKKQRFKFLHEVKAEMKRVTWPSRSEVLRWTGVVVAALVFFGVFVAVLDNLIITPLMVALSGIGA